MIQLTSNNKKVTENSSFQVTPSLQGTQDPITQGTIPGYPAIRQVKGWTISPRDRVLPGTGEVKDEECGKKISVAVCSSGDLTHGTQVIRHSCNRLECPTCFTRTLKRNAQAVSSRVIGYREALAGQRTLEGNKATMPRPPRHFILSPPMSVVNAVYDRTVRVLDRMDNPTSEQAQAIYLEKFRYELYKVLDLLGPEGDADIIHLDRVTDQGKKQHFLSRYDGSRWKWLRTQNDWQDLIYFSPHAHLEAYGAVMDVDEFYEKSGGWIYKNKGDITDLEGLSYYLLSHAPVIRGRLSVTYRGCLSPRKLKKVGESVHREEVLCEKCAKVFVFASLDDQGEIQHLTDRPLHHKRRIRIYAIVDIPGRGPPRDPGGPPPWR